MQRLNRERKERGKKERERRYQERERDFALFIKDVHLNSIEKTCFKKTQKTDFLINDSKSKFTDLAPIQNINRHLEKNFYCISPIVKINSSIKRYLHLCDFLPFSEKTVSIR